MKFRSHWKIIACDLDGTVIGWDHKVNNRDMDALRKIHAAGVHVAICTGRNSLESAGVIGALDLKGLGVFVNGAMVCNMDSGKTVRGRILEDAIADEVINFFGSMGHAVLGLADDAQARMPVYFMTEHGPPHHSTEQWLATNRMHSRICSEIPVEYRGRLIRLGIVVDVPERAAIEQGLQERFKGRAASHSIYSPTYDSQIIEVFAPGTNKWSGIVEVARELGVNAEQVIAIGDDTNDIQMLENAALSFAMGNARDEIKKFAKRLTLRQQECGVAAIIDDLLAGRLEPPI